MASGASRASPSVARLETHTPLSGHQPRDIGTLAQRRPVDVPQSLGELLDVPDGRDARVRGPLVVATAVLTSERADNASQRDGK